MQSDVQPRAFAKQPKQQADPVAHERRMAVAGHIRNTAPVEAVWKIMCVPGRLEHIAADIKKDGIIQVYGLPDKGQDQQ